MVYDDLPIEHGDFHSITLDVFCVAWISLPGQFFFPIPYPKRVPNVPNMMSISISMVVSTMNISINITNITNININIQYLCIESYAKSDVSPLSRGKNLRFVEIFAAVVLLVGGSFELHSRHVHRNLEEFGMLWQGHLHRHQSSI